MNKKTLYLISLLILGTLSPLNASGFRSRDVKVFNPIDSIFLAGMVTEPDMEKRAMIVLATGSGQQNRDEEILGHKPFKVIAEKLSENGFVVLRMDDRGYGESEGADIIMKAVNDDFVSDIRSGLTYLKNEYGDIPIGVLGHSEGGTIAIKIAADSVDHCDFIITLAAPAWPGDSLIMSQSRAISTTLTGSWEEESTERNVLDIVMSSVPDFQKRLVLISVLGEKLGPLAQMPEVQKSLSQQIDAMLTPWYEDMLRYNPADHIKSVTIPWLALNGTKDLQVPVENLKTIEELCRNVTAISLKDHNHLFQVCTTGLPQEYRTIEMDISPLTLDTIVHWLDDIFPINNNTH